MEIITWDDITYGVRRICEWAKDKNFSHVYGIPRGGLVIAVMISHALGIPFLTSIDAIPSDHNVLIVDEIVDSGETIRRLKEQHKSKSYAIACLYKRYTCGEDVGFVVSEVNHDNWLAFPWETSIEDMRCVYER